MQEAELRLLPCSLPKAEAAPACSGTPSLSLNPSPRKQCWHGTQTTDSSVAAAAVASITTLTPAHVCVPSPASGPHSSCRRMTAVARPEPLLHRTEVHRVLITEFLHNAVDSVCTHGYLPAALPALTLKHSRRVPPLTVLYCGPSWTEELQQPSFLPYPLEHVPPCSGCLYFHWLPFALAWSPCSVVVCIQMVGV